MPTKADQECLRKFLCSWLGSGESKKALQSIKSKYEDQAAILGMEPKELAETQLEDQGDALFSQDPSTAIRDLVSQQGSWGSDLELQLLNWFFISKYDLVIVGLKAQQMPNSEDIRVKVSKEISAKIGNVNIFDKIKLAFVTTNGRHYEYFTLNGETPVTLAQYIASMTNSQTPPTPKEWVKHYNGTGGGRPSAIPEKGIIVGMPVGGHGWMVCNNIEQKNRRLIKGMQLHHPCVVGRVGRRQGGLGGLRELVTSFRAGFFLGYPGRRESGQPDAMDHQSIRYEKYKDASERHRRRPHDDGSRSCM